MPTPKDKARRPGKAKDGRALQNPRLRGTQRKSRTEKVLGPADDQTIIDELRRFAPICLIASKLNVARHTLSRYIHGKPELQSELEDRDESMVDLTHRALFDASIGNAPMGKDGEPTQINVNAAMFLLERKGKSRGFSQHIEVEQAEVPSFTFSRRDAAVRQ